MTGKDKDPLWSTADADLAAKLRASVLQGGGIGISDGTTASPVFVGGTATNTLAAAGTTVKIAAIRFEIELCRNGYLVSVEHKPWQVADRVVCTTLEEIHAEITRAITTKRLETT
jgi:hypothetical protein